MTKHVVILGAKGQLGSAFLHAETSLWPQSYQITYLSHAQLDITDSEGLERVFQKLLPIHCVMNAAVLLPVDLCEKNSEKALVTNGLSLFSLAKICHMHDALLVHFSTDHVFDGMKRSPYTEEDFKKPLNVYGQSKYMGELILESLGYPYLLLRSSWLMSEFGQNFVRKIWDWSAQDREITIVDDQIGSPTFIDDIVKAVSHMVTIQLEERNSHQYGSFHLCGRGETTWYDYACFILAEIERLKPVKLRIRPISSKCFQSQNPHVADRPLYAALSCEKIHATYGIESQGWHMRIQDVVKALMGSERLN